MLIALLQQIATTPTGKLMLTMLAGIATFEREMMLERQLDGIKEAGKYKGRKATAKAKSGEVMELLGQGMTKEAVAGKGRGRGRIRLQDRQGE